MSTISVLVPSTLPEKTSPNTTSDSVGCRGSKVVPFQCKEEFMLPCDWAETGNPTDYELRVSIQSCRKLWYMNRDALEDPRFDHEQCRENIHVLEKMHIHLMAYLVE